jgi:hypothetical protein
VSSCSSATLTDLSKKGWGIMKAGIYFTGSGPILLLTSYDSLTDPQLVAKLAAKGIKKFIAFEVSVESVREKYGQLLAVIMGDLQNEADLRLLDYDGHHVMSKFSIKEMGQPMFHEP